MDFDTWWFGAHERATWAREYARVTNALRALSAVNAYNPLDERIVAHMRRVYAALEAAHA
jgi:hypothetical protein